MEEKEICLKSNVPFEELKNFMFDKGFKVQEDFQMNDIYMIGKDVDITLDNKDIIFKDNILVRETVGKRILLVNKIKELDDNGVVIGQRCVKCPITDSLSDYNFLCSIGYKKVFELKTKEIDVSIIFLSNNHLRNDVPIPPDVALNLTFESVEYPMYVFIS